MIFKFLTLFFLTSVVPFSAPVEFELSLSSTLKLTLDVFLRPPSLGVGTDSVVMVAGAIVIGGVQSELSKISASL